SPFPFEAPGRAPCGAALRPEPLSAGGRLPHDRATMSRLKIAFVSSGGAARGLAHLGVLKACEELGIHPEIYVGAGAGALVSATYGQDIPLDVLLDAYRLPWRRRHRGPRLHASTFLGAPRVRDLLDPGYLLSGLFSIDRLER